MQLPLVGQRYADPPAIQQGEQWRDDEKAIYAVEKATKAGKPGTRILYARSALQERFREITGAAATTNGNDGERSRDRLRFKAGHADDARAEAGLHFGGEQRDTSIPTTDCQLPTTDATPAR